MGARPAVRKKLAELSWRDRALLAEAGLCLAGARLAVVALPFKTLAPRLGTQGAESTRAQNAEPTDSARLRSIGWAIAAVASRTPWRSMCLEQAVAAKAMLRRRRIPSTLYLGLARPQVGDERPLIAHAWVRCGDLNVTGGNRVDHYAVITSFADEPRRAG